MSLSHDLHQIGYRLSADPMNSMLLTIDLGVKGTDLHNNKNVCFERSMKDYVSRFTPSRIKVIHFMQIVIAEFIENLIHLCTENSTFIL